MADEAENPVIAVEEEDADEISDLEDRTKDYSTLKKISLQLDDLFDLVIAGFDDKSEQSQDIDRFWDVYNCVLNENQSYFGTSQVYVSAVADAVDALTTRDNNMLFPVNGRYATAIGPGGLVPYDLLGLLDQYVRDTKMRENIAPCLLRTGKVTSDYILSVGWKKKKYHTIKKKQTTEVTDETDAPIEGMDPIADIEEDEIEVGGPQLQVLDPRDVCFLPSTADTVEDCDIVVERLHYSKRAVKEAVADGIFEEEAAEELLDNFSATTTGNEIDTTKKATANLGIRLNSKGNKVAIIYRVWSEIKLKGKERRMCVSYFGGNKIKLACKRNPYWNDRVPVLHQAARKLPGAINGKSIFYKVEDIQYALNDVINEGLDSSQYSMMPITAVDPAKNPRSGSMVLNMGALWEVAPGDVKFMEFPQLWEAAFKMAGALSDRIMQSMGINPALLPHGNAGKKPTQAQVAQEQQVAQESVADNIAILENGIFNQVLAWFHDLDYQYREKSVSVKLFGQMGLQSKMMEVEPLDAYTEYNFQWYGTEGTKAVQQVQQQIAAMNVLSKIPPQALNGRKIDLGPVAEQIVEVAFGPRIAPNVLIDQRHQQSIDPNDENEMLLHGFQVTVQMMDNDVEHIKSHMMAMKQHAGQHIDLFKMHIMAHMKQLAAKSAEAAGGQKRGSGQPQPGGQPGGGTPGGAQPQIARPAQQPPGAIHEDQMQDPNRMPRA